MDAELKKQILRKMTYGMWVLATGHEDELEASSVTWVMQVSFAPPLVAIGIKNDSHLAKVIDKSRAFVMHLLAADQQHLAATFIKPTECAAGRIAGIPFKPSPVTGQPVLEGFPAYFEAKVVQITIPGDHAIVIGEVVGVDGDPTPAPFTLASAGWNYGG